MIVVETSIVQTRRNLKRNKSKVAVNDHPIADRLDRSYFGFDQDYYEKMPLLVNAMQENSYVDPSIETLDHLHKKGRFTDTRNLKLTTEHYKAIRRTSPRPFLYEYRNPIPAPFSKTHSKEYASRSWVEKYRNAQRLKNLNEIIKYLEKTVNAKFGDLKSQTHIAFSGIYVEPFHNEEQKASDDSDLVAQDSNKYEYKSNHKSDPLYIFKPDHPGEINLLAEGFRFAPAPSQSYLNEFANTIPMFRPIVNRKRQCGGHFCDENEIKNVKLSGTSEHESSDLSNIDKIKSFGFMLNLYPIHPTKQTDITSTTTTPATEIDKIYITTSRPIQFRRKSTFPRRRTSIKYNRPRFSSKTRFNSHVAKDRSNPRNNDIESTTMPKMIVHLNVFSLNKDIKDENVTETSTSTIANNIQTEPTTSSTTRSFRTFFDDYPILNSSNVEDYHVGSSGIIPIDDRTAPPPVLPIVTPNIPLFDTTNAYTEAPRMEPTEVFKFSPEDARIPDHYLTTASDHSDISESTRNFNEYIDTENRNVEARTLVVKLKKYEDTSEETTSEITEGYEDVTETYVPTINGHYRNIIHKSLSTLLRENSERYSKKLESSISSIRRSTYVPMYVEIRRNRTTQLRDND